MDKIEFVIDNWSLITALICVIIMAVQQIIKFISLPTASKIKELKSRLLEWVRQAEADLGSETGKFKLSQVYDRFCQEYPYLKKWFTLEKFDKLVGDALQSMREELEKSKIARMNALKLEDRKHDI